MLNKKLTAHRACDRRCRCDFDAVHPPLLCGANRVAGADVGRLCHSGGHPAFEEKNNVKFVTSFFDGNSEAYNKLRVGGGKEFDLVQADGFWPQLYHREGLIRCGGLCQGPGARKIICRNSSQSVQGADRSGIWRQGRLPVLLGRLWHHLQRERGRAREDPNHRLMFDPDVGAGCRPAPALKRTLRSPPWS